MGVRLCGKDKYGRLLGDVLLPAENSSASVDGLLDSLSTDSVDVLNAFPVSLTQILLAHRLVSS